MLVTFGLFSLFSSLCLLSSFFVIITKNPVFSTLFLILSFTNASCVLFTFNFEFLPIAFLVIYVGAIAVLLLFVLMMLNLKLAELQNNLNSFLPTSLVLFVFFIVAFIFIFSSDIVLIDTFNFSTTQLLLDSANIDTNKLLFSDSVGFSFNLKNVALPLFTDHIFPFILSGFVLLLAMIASIVLTLNKNFIGKSQNIYTQIMANFDESIVSFK